MGIDYVKFFEFTLVKCRFAALAFGKI